MNAATCPKTEASRRTKKAAYPLETALRRHITLSPSQLTGNEDRMISSVRPGWDKHPLSLLLRHGTVTLLARVIGDRMKKAAGARTPPTVTVPLCLHVSSSPLYLGDPRGRVAGKRSEAGIHPEECTTRAA